MIAITTSVFYHDELPIVLDRNYHLFKEWYILTSEKDKKTIELCSKYANVTILFFDFYKNGGFNKFGAIKKAQKIGLNLSTLRTLKKKFNFIRFLLKKKN